MKRFFVLATILFLSFGSFCHAQGLRDYDFQQERMLLASDAIFILSSLDNQDGICAYSYYGNLLWETTFQAKVTSWRLAGDSIFVFSKHRGGWKTYLTCLDRFTGRVIWERP